MVRPLWLHWCVMLVYSGPLALSKYKRKVTLHWTIRPVLTLFTIMSLGEQKFSILVLMKIK